MVVVALAPGIGETEAVLVGAVAFLGLVVFSWRWHRHRRRMS
jgi:hypothetical protein